MGRDGGILVLNFLVSKRLIRSEGVSAKVGSGLWCCGGPRGKSTTSQDDFGKGSDGRMVRWGHCVLRVMLRSQVKEGMPIETGICIPFSCNSCYGMARGLDRSYSLTRERQVTLRRQRGGMGERLNSGIGGHLGCIFVPNRHLKGFTLLLLLLFFPPFLPPKLVFTEFTATSTFQI